MYIQSFNKSFIAIDHKQKLYHFPEQYHDCPSGEGTDIALVEMEYEIYSNKKV